jgi:hypothetical protein
MKITELKIGDRVRIKMPSPQGERLSIPMQLHIFSGRRLSALRRHFLCL